MKHLLQKFLLTSFLSIPLLVGAQSLQPIKPKLANTTDKEHAFARENYSSYYLFEQDTNMVIDFLKI